VASFPGGLRDVIFAVVGNHRKQKPAKEKNILTEGQPRPTAPTEMLAVAAEVKSAESHH